MKCGCGCATPDACTCRHPVPCVAIHRGYGSTGTQVVAEDHMAEGTALAIPIAGGVGVVPLDLPFTWTASCGDPHRWGIKLAWSNTDGSDVNPALVDVSLAIQVLDGQGNVIETRPVGGAAKTLSMLLCGQTNLPQPECFFWPFPLAVNGRPMCIGSAEYESLQVLITNNQVGVGQTLNVEASVDAVPCLVEECVYIQNGDGYTVAVAGYDMG